MHYDCLIVDDEVALSKMTAEYFEMFDVKTQHVESAASCYAFLKENTADVKNATATIPAITTSVQTKDIENSIL